MTASRRRGKWLPCPLVNGAAQKAAPLTKGHEGKRPSARGAVKTGEAAREAGARTNASHSPRLDSEHGDGSGAVALLSRRRNRREPHGNRRSFFISETFSGHCSLHAAFL